MTGNPWAIDPLWTHSPFPSTTHCWLPWIISRPVLYLLSTQNALFFYNYNAISLYFSAKQNLSLASNFYWRFTFCSKPTQLALLVYDHFYCPNFHFSLYGLYDTDKCLSGQLNIYHTNTLTYIHMFMCF